MGILKRTIWPIVNGILGFIVFMIVMNISYEFLIRLSNVPIINIVLLLNASILGVDILTLDSFLAGSVSSMCFMNFCTSYDRFNEHNCYKKASRTCGILYCVMFALACYIVFSELGLSLSAVLNFTPYILFGILLMSGSKFE